jgi:hypothetical protein
MPKEIKPLIQPTRPPRGPTAGELAKIIENKPASTVAGSLANAKRQVDATSQK